MKTIETKVYTFDELSESAKECARNWWREHGLDYEWWDNLFEDAERIGLKITGFELSSNRHACGHFNCFGGAEQCANLILAEHGKDCETFKTATDFLADLTKLNAEITAVDGDDETNVDYETWQDKRGELDEEFLKSLLEDYSTMLQKELEWLNSKECVDETITANEYTFTETGERFG